MSKFTTLVSNFAREDEGAALAEYAILIGLIAGGVITIIGTFSTAIVGRFQAIIDILNGPPAATP